MGISKTFRSLGSLGVIVAFAAAGQSAPRAAGITGPVTGAPSCSVVQGTPAVTFSTTEGKVLAPSTAQFDGTTQTYGLATLGTPGTLMAASNEHVLVSRDKGCSWQELGTAEQYPLRLEAAGSYRAYGWTDNGNYLVRIDKLGITRLRVPLNSVLGVGVDKADGRHLRVGGDQGDIWESFDAGATWNSVGRAPVFDELTITYRVAFDPSDLNHVLIGRTNEGALLTTDGGASWSRSTLPEVGPTNMFNIVVSPVDGNIVWAQGIFLPHLDHPGRGRYMMRSTDGGRSFTPFARESAEITLVNGPVMAAHPTNANVLYFVFGTYFSNYGTDVYKYDAAFNRVTKTHNSAHDINAIAFSRENPAVMYFGLEHFAGF